MKNNSPLSNVYCGLILGGEGFIKETLKKIDVEQWQKKEVSHRKALKSGTGVEEILEAVGHHYKVSRDQVITGNNGAAKKTAIYLMKKRTGATNKEMGELFGGISYLAIAKTNQRFSEQMKEDEGLKDMVGKVEDRLSFVKADPFLLPSLVEFL